MNVPGNVIIRDREPFEQLNPADVAAYLRSEGWKEVEHQPDRVSIWVAPVNGEQLEMLLPLRRGRFHLCGSKGIRPAWFG
jgi:hypothetical protein